MFYQQGFIKKTSDNFAQSLKGYAFLVQSGMHGASQGIMAMMDGGNFFQGFISGALGSIAASGWTSAFGSGTSGMIAFGALAGGVGAELSGGNFFKGFLQGGIVAGLNHGMHEIAISLGGDPKAQRPTFKKRPSVIEMPFLIIIQATENL